MRAITMSRRCMARASPWSSSSSMTLGASWMLSLAWQSHGHWNAPTSSASCVYRSRASLSSVAAASSGAPAAASSTTSSSSSNTAAAAAASSTRPYRYVHFFHYFPLASRLTDTSNTTTSSDDTASSSSSSSSSSLASVRAEMLRSFAGSANPERARLFDTASYGIGVRGRIYIASEGINAQMIVPCDTYQLFQQSLRTICNGIFHDVRLYDGDTVTLPLPFDALHVRIRDRLVADGLTNEEHKQLDLAKCGTHLSPQQWHQQLHPDALILDVRNWFENEIGHFENARGIPVDSFRDTFPYVDELLAKHSNAPTSDTSTTSAAATTAPSSTSSSQPKLMIYCTGGIRCIKVGAYLTAKGYTNVNMLDGGINAYAQWLQANPSVASKFKGRNFNFDDRIKNNDNPRLSADILGKCHQCGVANDSHVNCIKCNTLFIQCDACTASKKGTYCSDACASGHDAAPSTAPKRVRRRIGLAVELPSYTAPKRMFSSASSSSSSSSSSPASAASSASHTAKLRQGPSARAAAAASSDATNNRSFSDSLHDYAERHSNFYGHDLLRELEEATWTTRAPRAHMLAGPLPGGLLNTLVHSLCGSTESSALVLELGTFTGHSALCMAEALPAHARLVTCELEDSAADFAQSWFDRHPAGSKIHIARGPADKSLSAIAACRDHIRSDTSSSTDGSDALRSWLLDDAKKRDITRGFDLIFIDANKQQYRHYYDYILQHNLLRRGGMMLVDNTLWNGAVCEPASTHRGLTKVVHAFNEYVAADTRTSKTLIPLRDGITMIRLR